LSTRGAWPSASHQLGERLGEENVAAHHGSLSRKLRLEAEKKLKEGQVRVLVATASLELGIDVGTVDLVCTHQFSARLRWLCSAWGAPATGAALFPRDDFLSPRATI
jgi:ATP-dependent helicase YprA (DUF1998 family)